MFRNHLAATLRNLARNRLYAAINIIGLAVGFSAAILAMLFVRDELSFDKWIPGYEHIFQISTVISSSNREPLFIEPSPEQTATWLETDFSEVEAATRLSHPEQVSLRRLPTEGAERLYWADPDFFDVIQLKVIAGDRGHALDRPDGLVVTRKIARKYFGRDDPIGEPIELVLPRVGTRSDEPHTMRITAVLEDLPPNSHFDLELLGSARAAFSKLALVDANPQRSEEFQCRAYTYFRLSEHSGAAALERTMPAFLKRHKAGNQDVENGRTTLRLTSIADIHLLPNAQFMMKPRGNLTAIYGITAVAMLIVTIATINYVNLTTARLARRNLEVGIRKTVGASRRAVFSQFMGESLVYSVIGASAAIALAELALPYINAFLRRDISFDYWRDPQLAGGMAALVLLTALCGGVYPALVLARFHPARILKNTSGRSRNTGLGRTLLVTTQFCILTALTISAGVVYRQTQYSMTSALQLDKDLVLLVDNGCSQEAFRDRVLAIEGVRSAACASPYALDMNLWRNEVWRADSSHFSARYAPVDLGFFETYGVVLLAGRTFARKHSADRFPDSLGNSSTANVIVNERTARLLGFVDPHQAIGQLITMDMQSGPMTNQVIGVVPDFQLSADRAAIEPTIYFAARNVSSIWHLSIKLSGKQLAETLRAIDVAWRATGSPHVIRRRFVDQYVQELYASQERQSRLLAVLSIVAVSIACLGLFGLAVAAAELRTQEIGVRKAMGAGTAEVMRLLLWQFAQAVLWANLIAWPLAGFLMHRWLQGFAYRIDLEPWLFVASSVGALLIALLTVGTHCYLVARAKPVVALRYE